MSKQEARLPDIHSLGCGCNTLYSSKHGPDPKCADLRSAILAALDEARNEAQRKLIKSVTMIEHLIFYEHKPGDCPDCNMKDCLALKSKRNNP